MLPIAREIFLMSLSIMKKSLDLESYKKGKKSEEFIYYKSRIMEITYTDLKKLFKKMVEEGLIIRCDCKANLKQGYKKCPLCGGCGFSNKK